MSNRGIARSPLGVLREETEARLSALLEFDTNGGCWLWSGAPNAGMGYGVIRVRGTRYQAHRLSWELSSGRPPGECDVPACVNPAHLFLGTPGDNNRDRFAKGRFPSPSGSAHYRAKFDEASVRDVLARLAKGERQRSVARSFGVNQSAISKIARGITWSRVAAAEGTQ